MPDQLSQPINASDSELGKKTEYEHHYNPDKLFPIPREEKRVEIGIDPKALPFQGYDCWQHYEFSWLNEKGKPQVALVTLIYNCDSSHIIESKSMKLYCNTFNQTKFKSADEVARTIKHDLSRALHCDDITVEITPLGTASTAISNQFPGESIDDLDIECDQYLVEPNYLTVSYETVEETLHSDLLKSNCLVTNQPDWGSVMIAYTGPKIDRAGLLRYIVSFRNHNEFHEQCIERIFNDIMTRCQPSKLTVYGRYTRRGGLDINPYRSTETVDRSVFEMRLIRQ